GTGNDHVEQTRVILSVLLRHLLIVLAGIKCQVDAKFVMTYRFVVPAAEIRRAHFQEEPGPARPHSGTLVKFRDGAKRLIPVRCPCSVDDGERCRLVALNYRDQLIHQRLGALCVISLEPRHLLVLRSVRLSIGSSLIGQFSQTTRQTDGPISKFPSVPFLENARRVLTRSFARVLVPASHAPQLRSWRLDFGGRVEQVIVVATLSYRSSTGVAGIKVVEQFLKFVLEALR